MICDIMANTIRLEERVYRDSESTYIENLKRAELSGFKEKLSLFSHFLCNTNTDYKYNETYLIDFVDRFLNFQKYIKIKDAIFLEIVKVVSPYSIENSDEEVEITIDQYWKFRGIKVDYLSPVNEKMICRENVTIRIAKNTERGRDVFIKDYEIIRNGKIIQKQLKEIMTELASWLEGDIQL